MHGKLSCKTILRLVGARKPSGKEKEKLRKLTKIKYSSCKSMVNAN